MAEDLVERLRNAAAYIDFRDPSGALEAEAAAEIERLTAALEEIAANDHMISRSPVGPGHGAGVNFGLEWSAKIARKALRGADETSESTK